MDADLRIYENEKSIFLKQKQRLTQKLIKLLFYCTIIYYKLFASFKKKLYKDIIFLGLGQSQE